MTLNDQIMKQLENKTLVQAHNFLLEQGVKSADIGMYLGEYLVGVTGKGQRTFNYSTDFPAEDAACIIWFEPQFQHQDGVDGEDVVQAGNSVSHGSQWTWTPAPFSLHSVTGCTFLLERWHSKGRLMTTDADFWNDLSPETLAIHADRELNETTALAPPIFQLFPRSSESMTWE